MDTNIQPTDTPILEWQAKQNPIPQRGKTWYTIAYTFIAFCIVFSIWTGAWTFTILIALTSATYWYLEQQPPKEHRIRIWNEGFAFDNDLYGWNRCSGFWMLKMPNFAELHIELTNGTHLRMQTGEIDPYTIYETLAGLTQELPGRKEGILDTFIRICKL